MKNNYENPKKEYENGKDHQLQVENVQKVLRVLENATWGTNRVVMISLVMK